MYTCTQCILRMGWNARQYLADANAQALSAFTSLVTVKNVLQYMKASQGYNLVQVDITFPTSSAGIIQVTMIVLR